MVAKRYRVNIDADKIRKAYFKFESLVDLDDQFKCCLCGYHPIILIFDVIRKCAFKMPYCESTEGDVLNEMVDIEKFWNNVSKFCINDHENGACNKVIPSLSFWAPWLPKQTRASQYVYNTESLKGAQENEENDYLKCLSEERLEELFNMGDVMTLREHCKECGIHASKLTRIDCIARLKSAVQSVAEIDKLFFNVWQASGGTLTATCPHGIVYAVKN